MSDLDTTLFRTSDHSESSVRPVRTSVLDSSLRVAMFGVASGNVSLRDSKAPQRLESLATSLQLKRVVVMRPNFTNIWLEDTQSDCIEGVQRIHLMRGISDGVLCVRSEGRGVVITSGDCATGVLFSSNFMLVMHLGLECLWSVQPRVSILERGISVLRKRGEEPQLWLGAAARGCCHGYDHSTQTQRIRAEALREEYPTSRPTLRVTHGPRRGAWAYDHLQIARHQAARAQLAHVSVEDRCTSCDGLQDHPEEDGYGLFFSHTRDRTQGRERNGVFVYESPID